MSDRDRRNSQRGAAARAALVNLEPPDVHWIARALGAWQCSDRWSAAWGRTLSPQALSYLVWHGVALQRVVRTDDDRPLALFQLADPDLDEGLGNLELLVARGDDDVDHLLRQFVARVFHEFPIRKLCMAAVPEDLDLLPCLAAGARPIGCLREHRRRLGDVYVDVNLYEIWPDDWPT